MARRIGKNGISEAKPSRQVQYQLRHKELGLCLNCSEPSAPGRHLCERHLAIAREHYRGKKLAGTKIMRQMRPWGEAPKQMICCRIPIKLYNDLIQAADQQEISATEVVIRALEAHLSDPANT